MVSDVNNACVAYNMKRTTSKIKVSDQIVRILKCTQLLNIKTICVGR